MKITKKFYVGSKDMINTTRNDWPKKTLQEAINHAKKLAESTGEDQIVVRIVVVIRRQKVPLVVEKV